MKAQFIDYVGAVLSVIVVGLSYWRGVLIYGIIAVCCIMSAIFMLHIILINRSLKGSISVFGTITGYHEKDNGKHVFPIVKYITEDGREISSVYTVQDTEKRYEHGSEELICYDPNDPVFFYFADREGDLIKDYRRLIFIGVISAVALLIFALARA